jgi:hypothetical protein
VGLVAARCRTHADGNAGSDRTTKGVRRKTFNRHPTPVCVRRCACVLLPPTKHDRRASEGLTICQTRGVDVRNVLLSAALAAAVTVAASASQLGDVLDLTIFQPSYEPLPDSFRVGGVATHTPQAKAPLRLTFLETDRASYQWKDTFEYRVRITNTGSVAYAIPWEPDWTRIGDVPGRRVVSCMVYLVIGSQPLSLGSIPIFDSAAWLYGSEDAPGTLKTLAPGGSVELIVPGRWNQVDLALEKLSLPGTFPVSAVLSFSFQPVPGRYTRPILSDSKSIALEPFDYTKGLNR